MTDKDKYIDKIKRLLLESSDELTKEKVLRLTSGAKCIGVTVPKIRQLAKDFKAALSDLDVESIYEIADGLLEENCREEVLFAIFTVALQKKNLHKLKWERINFWLNHLDNWETCDQLSIIVAFIVAKNPTLLKELFKLTSSDNKWKRRFAAATIANMNHGGKSYPKETFQIVKPLLTDAESVVTKAVGWAMREISKKCPEETFEFLHENLKTISKRLLKESSELLPEKERDAINGMK